MQLTALIRKELTLLTRDWHALLLLFAMPAVFILVMSLALQDRFALHQGLSVHYVLVDEDQSPQSQAFSAALTASKDFTLDDSNASLDDLREAVRDDQRQFLLVIPHGFGQGLQGVTSVPVESLSGPSVEPTVAELFAARVKGALAQVYLQQTLAPLAGGAAPDLSVTDRLLHSESAYSAGARPSSVQQSVPAWLLFAMFFIAIPLSTTWVQERQQGTYARLRSLGVSAPALLLGKLLPYVAITLVQVVLMLLVGVYLVPALGGDRLTLGHAPFALTLMALAVSFAAVSYALLIANLVSTAEQATIFTGVANLLMAAIGGIMVPRFIMPAAMQALSLWSPMAWGLDGFLDVFLRQGDARMVAPEVARLGLFGLACLALAALSLKFKARR